MFTVTLDTRLLKASALVIADKKESRHYLHGVCVDVRPERTVLVATDGRMLLVTHVPRESGDEVPSAPCQFIVPRDALAALKLDRRMNVTVLKFDPGKFEASAAQPCLDSTIGFKCIDAKYPDFAHVIARASAPVSAPAPEELAEVLYGRAPPEPAQFDPRYLAALQKAYDVAGGHDGWIISVHPRGPRDGAFVAFPSDVRMFGIIMPFRCEETTAEVPTWFNPPALACPDGAACPDADVHAAAADMHANGVPPSPAPERFKVEGLAGYSAHTCTRDATDPEHPDYKLTNRELEERDRFAGEVHAHEVSS